MSKETTVKKKKMTAEEKRVVFSSVRQRAAGIFRFYENWEMKNSARKALYKLR